MYWDLNKKFCIYLLTNHLIMIHISRQNFSRYEMLIAHTRDNSFLEFLFSKCSGTAGNIVFPHSYSRFGVCIEFYFESKDFTVLWLLIAKNWGEVLCVFHLTLICLQSFSHTPTYLEKSTSSQILYCKGHFSKKTSEIRSSKAGSFHKHCTWSIITALHIFAFSSASFFNLSPLN